MNQIQAERRIAAIDLGSNSFHMIVTSADEQGHIRVLDKLRESVRLRGGLDDNNNLSAEVRLRALDCLQRFGERIRDFSSTDVAAVGTNTLRQTRQARRFLNQAEKALGHPISVISGREEARLIYLGVSHTLAEENDSRRLVMDIGGGSTELIIGEGFKAKHLESLSMGCVSSSQHFFPEGDLSKAHWKKAMTAARLELMPIQRRYLDIGWESVTGASGTIKSVLRMIRQCELSPYSITLSHLRELQKRMIDAGRVDKLNIPGLSDERRPVIAGGLAILMSAFEALSIDEMLVSDGALREGLVYDRIDRFQHGDLRSKTVMAIQQRFQVDVVHAARVRETAWYLFDACRASWGLTDTGRQLLGWAATLHELGLSISHNAYQKHGGYLLNNLDLAGFSTEEQDWLGLLVRMHRRKISQKLFDDLEFVPDRSSAVYLSVLLRLAVLLHRGRGEVTFPLESVTAEDNALRLVLLANTEQQRPLLSADLDAEIIHLENVGIKLRYDDNRA